MTGMASKGTGTVKRRWAGTWWKPWTWLRYNNVVTGYKLVSFDMVKNPPPGCEFHDFERDPADRTAYMDFGPEMDAHYDCGDK